MIYFIPRTIQLSLLLLVVLCGSAYAENNFAFRPELDLAGPVGKDLSWGLKLETVFESHQEDASALLARVSWKPLDNLSVTPEFLYGSKGENHERRPRLDVEASTKIGAYTYALRGRAEYRMKENKDSYWRYRARLKIKFPKIAGIKPFIYDEVFYEAGTKNEFNTNEAGLGAGIPLLDKVSLVLDLRFITARKDDHWLDPDIHLLSTIEIRF